MDTTWHIENRKTGASRDLPTDDAETWLIQQFARNDPAMSWARAQELARSQMTQVRESEQEAVLYSIAVELQ